MPTMPEREQNLARPRSRKGSDQQETKRGTMLPVSIPDADPDWHPIATMLWESLLTSGQKDFFQNTDWVFAYSLCEDITRYKESYVNSYGETAYKRSPEMLKAIQAGMGSLLVTEGDRRRLRVELAEPPQESKPAAVAVMDDYRKGLAAAPALDDEDSPEDD